MERVYSYNPRIHMGLINTLIPCTFLLHYVTLSPKVLNEVTTAKINWQIIKNPI